MKNVKRVSTKKKTGKKKKDAEGRFPRPRSERQLGWRQGGKEKKNAPIDRGRKKNTHEKNQQKGRGEKQKTGKAFHAQEKKPHRTRGIRGKGKKKWQRKAQNEREPPRTP